MNSLNEQNIFIFLVQFFLLLILSKGLGELFRRWHQPSLTAEILVGVALGPTILGRFFPSLEQLIFPSDPMQKNMLETISWIGVFFLLETGLTIDFSVVWRQRTIEQNCGAFWEKHFRFPIPRNFFNCPS